MQSADNKWYVLKSTQRFGPYEYDEMISMMQTRSLFDFDYIWTQGMQSWTPLAEVPSFQENALRDHLAAKKSTAFVERRTPRVTLSVPLYIHNNHTLWTGKTVAVSGNGALIVMNNPILLPGQSISINFKKQAPEDLSFNVTAEILSKKFTRQRIKYDTQVQYAVKFLTKDPSADLQINRWTTDRSKNKTEGVAS